MVERKIKGVLVVLIAILVIIPIFSNFVSAGVGEYECGSWTDGVQCRYDPSTFGYTYSTSFYNCNKWCEDRMWNSVLGTYPCCEWNNGVCGISRAGSDSRYPGNSGFQYSSCYWYSCGTDSNCNDGDPCTIDQCMSVPSNPSLKMCSNRGDLGTGASGCTTGCQCASGLCVEGVCKSSCTPINSVTRCSKGSSDYTSSGNCAWDGSSICDDSGHWALYINGNYYARCGFSSAMYGVPCDTSVGGSSFSANGVCVNTGACDTNEVCLDGTYRDDCNKCSSGSPCERIVGGSWGATGVCVRDTAPGTNLNDCVSVSDFCNYNYIECGSKDGVSCPYTCGTGETCVSNKCESTCTDDYRCSSADAWCSGSNWYRCADTDSDGCLEYSSGTCTGTNDICRDRGTYTQCVECLNSGHCPDQTVSYVCDDGIEGDVYEQILDMYCNTAYYSCEPAPISPNPYVDPMAYAICGDCQTCANGDDTCNTNKNHYGTESTCYNGNPAYVYKCDGSWASWIDTCLSSEYCSDSDGPGGNIPTCEPIPAACTCGDGELCGTEACDDGNRNNGDGCSSSCQVESSCWSCTSPGSLCRLRNDCAGCSKGSDCVSGICVAGTCRISCSSYPGALCSDDGTDTYSNDGICASGICDEWQATRNGGTYYSSLCGSGTADGYQCDAGDLRGGFSNEGVCCSGSCNLGASSCCSPLTSCTGGRECGTQSDGCGGTLNCGNCRSGEYCSGNYCYDYCGDGTVQSSQGETCDDGNTASGDGCSSTCQKEPGYSCPSGGGSCTLCSINSVSWNKGSYLEGETATINVGTNWACNGKSVRVDIRKGWSYFTSAGTGTVSSSSLSRNWFIDIDSEGNNYFARAYLVEKDTIRRDSSDVTIEFPYIEYCGISGCQASEGENCATCPEDCGPCCGNGVENTGEECDDGNRNNGDGCSSTCTIEPGWSCPQTGGCTQCSITSAYWSPGSDIDEGTGVNLVINTNSACNGKSFYLDVYRDALIDSHVTSVSGITVNSGSASRYWTSNVDNEGEHYFRARLQENTNIRRDSDRIYISFPVLDQCGINGCQASEGENCLTCPEDCGECPPSQVCGDDSIDGTETCDDGNTASGDGCSSTCTIESGWECSGEPSNCWRSCGDRTLDSGEQCDDGNRNNGDGCSSNCQIETGCTCDNSPMPSTCECNVVGCTISVAEWSTATATEGETVYLNIRTPNCPDGTGVTFQIWEDDPISDDDPTTQPAPTTITSNRAYGVWTAEYQDDTDEGQSNPPEYVFRAELDNNEFMWSSLPKLEVSQADICAGSTGCDFYTTQGDCEADACNLGNSLSGYTCGFEYDPITRCMIGNICDCVWDITGGVCEPFWDGSISCEECGNGVEDYGEECDDGNNLDGDGCSALCLLEDGHYPPCKEGLTLCADGTCSINCGDTDGGPAACNYDTICDANEGCNCPDCDGELDSCEPGLLCSLIDEACCSSVANGVCNPYCAYIDPDCAGNDECGNGFRGFGEECDDGNLINNDGCSSTCTYEELDPPCPEGTMLCNNGKCSLNCHATDDGYDPACMIDSACCEGDLKYSLLDNACCPDGVSDGYCNPYCALSDVDCNSGIFVGIDGIGACSYTKNSDDDCSDGILKRDYTAIWAWDETNEFTLEQTGGSDDYVEDALLAGLWHYDPKDLTGLRKSDRCTDISDELICPAQIQLPAFGTIQIIIAIISIAIAYTIIVFRRRD